jgi:hypothetical protein
LDAVRSRAATFVSTVAFDPEHLRALALYCSDTGCTEWVEELLQCLGHPRLDTLTIQSGCTARRVMFERA